MFDRLKSWYFQRKIARGVYILENLDAMMIKSGYKRHERRQFWREFSKHQQAREMLFERLKV